MSFAADWLRRARARQRARVETIDRRVHVTPPMVTARYGKSEATRSMQRDFDDTVEMALEGLARLRRGEGC